MAQGISINIGLNSPGPDCCVSNRLDEAENSARWLADFARAKGFQVRGPAGGPPIGAITGGDATAANVDAALAFASRTLVSGDILFLSFAGHGCQLPDSSPEEERDHFDETWCLADRQYRDDEVLARLQSFAPGVRIFIVLDNCHSGGFPVNLPTLLQLFDAIGTRLSALEADVATIIPKPRCFESPPRSVPAHGIKASVLLLASCSATTTAFDGVFMLALKKALGDLPTSYCDLYDKTRLYLDVAHSAQTPEFGLFGAGDFSFPRQVPFTVEAVPSGRRTRRGEWR